MDDLVPNALPPCFDSWCSRLDSVFSRSAQRRCFRTYLAGLLGTSHRKNLSQLADHTLGVSYESLHHFLTASPWDELRFNSQRISVMSQCRQTKPSRQFRLVLDDSGHRKSGSDTDGVGRQYLGEIGKVDNGMVLVSTHLVDGVRRLPLDLALYQHGSSLPEGKQDPEFVKKPDLAIELVDRCLARGMNPDLVLADAAYGTNTKFIQKLEERKLNYIVGLAKNRRVNAQLPGEQEGHKHTVSEVAHSLSSEQFVEVDLLGEKPRRVWVAVVKLHVARLGQRWITIIRDSSSWETTQEVDYLMSNVSGEKLSEEWIVRTYQERNWVEVFYREAKGWLGLREYQVRGKRAIVRHWYLVFAAYTFIHWQQLTGGLRRRWSSKPLKSFAEGLEAFRTGLGYRLVKWIGENLEAFRGHKEARGYRWAL